MSGEYAGKRASDEAKCRDQKESRHFIAVTLPLMTGSLILGLPVRVSNIAALAQLRCRKAPRVAPLILRTMGAFTHFCLDTTRSALRMRRPRLS